MSVSVCGAMSSVIFNHSFFSLYGVSFPVSLRIGWSYIANACAHSQTHLKFSWVKTLIVCIVPFISVFFFVSMSRYLVNTVNLNENEDFIMFTIHKGIFRFKYYFGIPCFKTNFRTMHEKCKIFKWTLKWQKKNYPVQRQYNRLLCLHARILKYAIFIKYILSP